MLKRLFLFAIPLSLQSLGADEAHLPQTTLVPGPFISLDAIIWNVHESGLANVIRNEDSALICDDGDVLNPDFQWGVGFKAGIGYRFPHKLWELGLELTRLHIKAPTRKKAHEGDVFFPTWTNTAADGPGNVQEVDGRWRLHFGTLDLMLARGFYPVDDILIRPAIGLRGAIVRQKYQFLYKGGSLFPDSEDWVNMKNKFMGGGPRIALETQWYFVRDWSVYALGGISLIYGDFYVHQTEKAEIGTRQRLKVFDRFQDISAATDLLIGLAYNGVWRKNAFWQVHFGWEQHVFFDQNHLLRFVSEQQGGYVTTSGNIALQGFDVGIRLEF